MRSDGTVLEPIKVSLDYFFNRTTGFTSTPRQERCENVRNNGETKATVP